jgi:hypothetical protein
MTLEGRSTRRDYYWVSPDNIDQVPGSGQTPRELIIDGDTESPLASEISRVIVPVAAVKSPFSVNHDLTFRLTHGR